MQQVYDKLQGLVMQASADEQELRQELRRAEARDRDTYELTWQAICTREQQHNQSQGQQTHMQALLDCAKLAGELTKQTVVRQPLLSMEGKGTMEELEELASTEHCERLHSLMRSLVEASGGTYLGAHRKGRDRCVQKASNEYGGDFSRLLDVERGTGLFKHAEGMLKCLELLQQEQGQREQRGDASSSSSSFSLVVQLLRCKDRLNSPLDSGYRDLLLNVRCVDGGQALMNKNGPKSQPCDEGFVAELQLNFFEIAEIKSHSHRFFELVRVLKLPWIS